MILKVTVSKVIAATAAMATLLAACGGGAAPSSSQAAAQSASATPGSASSPAAGAKPETARPGREQMESKEKPARPAAKVSVNASLPGTSNAASLPADSPATSGAQAAPQAAIRLNLGTPPRQVFSAGQFGMTDVPDQQPAIVQQPNSQSYLVFLNGRFGQGTKALNAGHVGLFTTADFVTYSPVVGSATQAQPVFGPSCDDKGQSCLENFDADYLGANTVFRARNGSDLLMIYNGVNTYFGASKQRGAFYAEIGLARSTDQGAHWTRQGVIVQGTDPKPSTSAATDSLGTPQPDAIVAGDYMYVFYPYFPTKGFPDEGPPTIQVARAPVASDGAPGTWTKYYNGSFGSEPGLRPGRGSQVVPTVSGCTRPAQPSVTFSTYLNEYVLTFLCEQGWFFSTSTDLVTWTPPTQFFTEPNGEFKDGQPTDENMVLVTPGDPGQVIGQTGYVLYSYRPSWGHGAGELWMRPFTFDRLGPSALPVPSGQQPV